jgi:hypothetical protein
LRNLSWSGNLSRCVVEGRRKPNELLPIYIEHVEKNIIACTNPHDTQLFMDKVLAPDPRPLTDRQRLELAEDSREPPGTITLLHGRLVARVRISQCQRGDTRVCAKTIACTDSQKKLDWLGGLGSPLGGRSTPMIEDERCCARSLPHCTGRVCI